MTDPTPRILNCPTCGKAVKWTSQNTHRPFCSERCKLIDFGAWADAHHKIPGHDQDDLSSDLDQGEL
ncbi:MAG: DNA gyrase inhibitor YacG [Pseudomonadales bacterium]|jgi:hypothetical protein|nr:DNA gyrase inhibitor YacG [Pseudomonadales bacterium]MDP6470890.1 DNA gyrase inhibitor YacG [Pseudomonadales bacterium]MDP6825925.1 DNA gyrase inhibitor YacG [Pseudomonadales bacterium]MDP6972237.1 DNA gyrase inhibitor YacG [Pseudomonadales bacterium]|tara:strand:- start:236 stop:436 length:201 start_codon:yes stop_codon:yes gene_type:complete